MDGDLLLDVVPRNPTLGVHPILGRDRIEGSELEQTHVVDIPVPVGPARPCRAVLVVFDVEQRLEMRKYPQAAGERPAGIRWDLHAPYGISGL
ncbi:MAG: hypothetical protein M5T61_15615 [Acidimicrobiia bacterium]|nr:hypothetical protein [Acidimicrobiia bacterium]